LTANISVISPLFSFILYFYIFAIIASVDYPNQKYVLFKKLPDGRIKKVETLTEPITWEQAIAKHGPGPYMLQSMKPRVKVIWNHLSASSEDGTEKNEVQTIQLQRIERKTNYLTGGLIALGTVTGIGFAATAISLLNKNQLLNRVAIAIDSIIAKYPIPGFLCATCLAPLVSMFDRFCNQCGYPITSPDRREILSANEQRCPQCSFPIRAGQRYCRECGQSLQNQSSRSGWSLP